MSKTVFEGKFIESLKKIVPCEKAKIETVLDTMYFFTGETKQPDPNFQVIKVDANGKSEIMKMRDYVCWTVVASGKTKIDLERSVKRYAWICSLTADQLISEVMNHDSIEFFS